MCVLTILPCIFSNMHTIPNLPYILTYISISFIKSVPWRKAYLKFMDLAHPLYLQ